MYTRTNTKFQIDFFANIMRVLRVSMCRCTWEVCCPLANFCWKKRCYENIQSQERQLDPFLSEVWNRTKMHAVSCTSLNLLSSLFMQLMFSVAPLVAGKKFIFIAKYSDVNDYLISIKTLMRVLCARLHAVTNVLLFLNSYSLSKVLCICTFSRLRKFVIWFIAC